MESYLIKNIVVVNEGRTTPADVLIRHGKIEKIGRFSVGHAVTEINGEGKYLLPGAIDDQVHFREPGLTHKATIATEAKAAVAGGVTSFIHWRTTRSSWALPTTMPKKC
jgi:dihydroorotase